MLGTPVVESRPSELGRRQRPRLTRLGPVPPPASGEGADLYTSVPQPASGPQEAVEEGARSEDDQDWCLYVGTPWEAEVIADRRDLDEFKEASRAIGRVLSIRVLVDLLEFLLRVLERR
jgi:hypothetical protein